MGFLGECTRETELMVSGSLESLVKTIVERSCNIDGEENVMISVRNICSYAQTRSL